MYAREANFWELHETLAMKHRFALWQIYPLHRDPVSRVTWSDALWLREDVLASQASSTHHEWARTLCLEPR